MATNMPFVPSMILSPRMTKESLKVILANAFSLSSSRREIRTSEISSVIPSPPRVPDLDPSKSLGSIAGSDPSHPPNLSAWSRPSLLCELRQRDASFGGTHDVEACAQVGNSVRGRLGLLSRQCEPENRGTTTGQKGSQNTARVERASESCNHLEFRQDNVLEIIVKMRRDRVPFVRS